MDPAINNQSEQNLLQLIQRSNSYKKLQNKDQDLQNLEQPAQIPAQNNFHDTDFYNDQDQEDNSHPDDIDQKQTILSNRDQLQEIDQNQNHDDFKSQNDINNFLNDQLAENFRLSNSSLRRSEQPDPYSLPSAAQQLRHSQKPPTTNSAADINSRLTLDLDEENDKMPKTQQRAAEDSGSKPKNKNTNNIFGKARAGGRDSLRSNEINIKEGGSSNNLISKIGANNANNQGQGERENKKVRLEKSEREFENKCLRLLKIGDWAAIDTLASSFLEDTQGKSFKGFFYLGVSFYKTQDFDNAIRAFYKAEEINSEDAQLHYNLGLTHFKREQYNEAVEHFKKCTKFDENHIHAYNNLAFLFNMHQFYSETIQVCGQAKMNNPKNHSCHRHWSFALFKKGEFAKAIKKIKKGVQKNPTDPENWIIWGLILRTVGNYVSARHKFRKALKIDKENETAKEELQIVDRIIELDKQIPLESVPSLRRNPNTINNSQINNPKKGISKEAAQNDGEVGGWKRTCQNNGCKIF